MTAPAIPADVQSELDDRYGRRRGPRRSWIVVGIIAIAAIGYLAWTTVAQSVNSVDVDTTGFRLVDAHTVAVDFQVTTHRTTGFACAVEAQDTEHGIVGWRVIEYPADAAHTRSFTETVPTVAEATTGLVGSCWIP